MHKSIRKSLYLCAAALMIGGVVAPSVSNGFSASARSRYSVSRYSHKRNAPAYSTKRISHLQRVHSYHLRMEKKDQRNLAGNKKTLKRYNHLLRVHKHNHRMIKRLNRAKRQLIKMIKTDQRGITRQAKLIESEEHQINAARKSAKAHMNGTMSLTQYNSYLSNGFYDGAHGKKANPRGNKQAKSVYESGYLRGLAKFSQNLKKLHSEAIVNHAKYLNGIAYSAGFDDGYHSSSNNYDNNIIKTLLRNFSGQYSSLYRQGLDAGRRAQSATQNRHAKTVVPKVIVPKSFGKIVKPKVIMPSNLSKITQNKSDGQIVKPKLVTKNGNELVIPKVINNNGKVVKPKLVYPDGKVVKPKLIIPKKDGKVVIPKVINNNKGQIVKPRVIL